MADFPDINVHAYGTWYGPDYPQNGWPPHHVEALDGPLYDEPDEDPDDDRVPVTRDSSGAVVRGRAASAKPTDRKSDDAGQASSDGPPPKAGPGSAKGAWVAYAAKHDVAVADDDTRDDIIAACERADVPTE